MQSLAYCYTNYICPSVQCHYCVERIALVVKLFPSSDRANILVFEPPRRCQIPKEPLSGGVKCIRIGKYLSFSTANAVYLGTETRQGHIYYYYYYYYYSLLRRKAAQTSQQ